MLRIEDLHFSYGQAMVLRGVTLQVGQGEIVGVIGPNGSGKTTLMRLISGLIKPLRGAIWFRDQRIDLMPAHLVARSGIVHVPEGRHLFPRMSVLENLELGWRVRPRGSFPERLEYVYEIFPILAKRRNQLAGLLSGGEQQMLAIARALMAYPELLLLDEPSLALSPIMTKKIFDTIEALHKREGLTMLIVSQEVAKTLGLAQRCYVLENGVIVEEGTGAELASNPRIKEVYLGI
jgi:branched-chain amino acid transport system ATP-binding protein